MTKVTVSERSEQKTFSEANLSLQLGVWGRCKPPSGGFTKITKITKIYEKFMKIF